MSQSSAMPSVIMPSEAKARWSRLSLKNTDENPATRTIVVMIIPVPTSANAWRIASVFSSPWSSSKR